MSKKSDGIHPFRIYLYEEASIAVNKAVLIKYVYGVSYGHKRIHHHLRSSGKP